MKTPRRRLRLLYWLGGLLLIAGLVAGSWWMLAPRRPNLLLITLDTTRADRLGCYGYNAAKTPTLDALANSGARFSRAYATAPLTLPSHATMMTGLYTPEHGLRTNGRGRLHSEIPTLAESLQPAGYRTGAFVGAFVLDAEFGLNQGFDEYDADLSQSRRTDDPLHRERPGNAVVDRALAWLGADANEPFFCWVHLYDPHFVYQSHAAEFGDEFEQRPYDGELAFVDQQVQRLTGFLTSNEIAEDTLVIIVGDHGEGLGDHQEMMHGYMLYNSTLHVPWIVSWPGRIPSDVVVDEPVSLVDLMPTTLDCLGVPPPLDMTGQSLKPAFTGQSFTPSICYAETDDPRLDNGWSGLQTILTPEWKYIRTADPELYHRPDDVAELDDRADVEVEQLQQMDQALLDFLASLTPRKIDLANLSSRDVRVLSSLGYTAGQSSLQPPDDTSGPDIKVMVPHFNRVVDATHLMEAGRFSEAEPLLRETVEAVPDYLAALGTLGRCLAQQGQIDEAREWYRRVLEKSPEDTSALLNLATADLAQQRPEDARKVLQKLLEIDPSSADANFYLAQASLQAGDAEQARRDFDRAIACDPEHVESLSSLGDLHFERGELDRALPYYEAAIRLDPYSPGPFINRGIALGQMSRLNEAIACFQDGLKFSPDDPLLHSNLGFAFQQSGYLKEAIEHYNATMSVAPDEPLASVNLPMLLSAAPDAKLRDGPRAVEIAARAVKASRGASPEAYDALAAAYAETGRFEEATTAIETALRSPNLETTQFQDMRRRADLYRSHTPYRLAP